MKVSRDDYNRQLEIERRLETVEEQLSRLRAMKIEALIRTRRINP